ncbi:plasmid SOS inhibition protein A [Serratia marcescens]|uniref:plasmid SOS inhibition protein A n=1 Tax=Serratia marcescens TaxID=615 RepID=UPI000AE5B191|nr:plasmid SOS inhibition protein A [Serratia marcescens]
MIPNHLALVPWHPDRRAVWQAIAQVEARREAGRRLSASPYATAFFRQLTGLPTLSAKDIRMIDVTYRHGDRRRATRKEDYIDALDTLIASRGEHCYSPLPGDTRDTLFPEVNCRRNQRFEHRLTMKHTRQARIDATLRRHKRRRYQVRLAQAWTARFPCLAELDSYLWGARLQVSLISAELSAEAHIDNAARLPTHLVGR